MALSERTEDGQITILPDGNIQLRLDTVIERDGREIHRTHHRTVLEPGADVSRLSARLQAIAKVIWTNDVLSSWKAVQEERGSRKQPA